MKGIRVEISHDGNGWSIDLIHPTEKKTAWAENSQSAYHKASIIADYYRDENGQPTKIIWVHILDREGKVVKNL